MQRSSGMRVLLSDGGRRAGWRMARRCASTAVEHPVSCSSFFSEQVPIIDLSLPPAQLGAAVHKACTTVGFFHVVNHDISPDLQTRVLDAARRFFALPLEKKEALSVANSNSYRGYQRVGVNITKSKLDGHEALDLLSESRRADRHRADGLTNYGQNQWPNPKDLPDLRPMLEEEYIPQMSQVGNKLLSAAALGLGLGHDFFRPYFTDSYWSMRLIQYPAANADDYEFGCGEHSDYGVFTMILCDTVQNTLQIRPKGQADWVTVDPMEGGFICNIGDMLARWTNNIYVSTPHRVLRPIGQSRLSVPFFFDPNYDSLIAPIPELVEQSGRPACFEPILYGDHLLGKTSKNFLV